MKKFFAEHPIAATCLSTCSVLFILVLLVTILIGIVLTKSLSALSDATHNTLSNEIGLKYKHLTGNIDSENKILSIPIKGVILNDKAESAPFASLLSTETYGYTIKNQLSEAAKDPTVKAIILEINSPGGTITGAAAISDGIAYYKQQTKKPVLAHVSGLGASGGYWVAAAADTIMSDAGSLVGSIGVIMGPFKYYNRVLSESDFGGSVVTQNGIESFNITAGTDKDFGDPYKRMSEKSISILQEGINQEYQIFVKHVSSKRNITEDTIKNTLGALVYGNAQALRNGLIDKIGSRNDAYTETAKMAQLKDYQVVYQDESDFFKELFRVALLNRSVPASKCIICGQMLFLYGSPTDYIKN